MTATPQDQALAEFRDASAACRRAFAAHSEAREAQILANKRAADTSDALLAAQDRLDRADHALNEAKATPPAPADIDAAKGFGVVGVLPNGVLPNGPAPVTHTPEPADMGIG